MSLAMPNFAQQDSWDQRRPNSPQPVVPPLSLADQTRLRATATLRSPGVTVAEIRRWQENESMHQDYWEDIDLYMYQMETGTLASADLMDMQPELQWYMRPYLIDFIIEVHQQFRLRPEVLFLTMNIVDRYVSKRVVYKKHYQLVGCAALWIAAKFEDAKEKVPLVKELVEMCCKAYDESAFIQMEGHVLSTVMWQLGHPTAEAWLRAYVLGDDRYNEEDLKVQSVARFLMEITLFHREFVGIQASIIAGGALKLARFICGTPRRVGTCSFQQSIPRWESICVRVAYALDKHFGDRLESVSEIVSRKYSALHYAKASLVVREFYLSGHRFNHNPLTPSSPYSQLPSPGLAPSGSWGSKRSSWMSTSPSGGSISCSSSETEDEPRTPITPLHQHSVDPFSVSTKENVAAPQFGAPPKVPSLHAGVSQENVQPLNTANLAIPQVPRRLSG